MMMIRRRRRKRRINTYLPWTAIIIVFLAT
jgi:hypothetical protein